MIPVSVIHGCIRFLDLVVSQMRAVYNSFLLELPYRLPGDSGWSFISSRDLSSSVEVDSAALFNRCRNSIIMLCIQFIWLPVQIQNSFMMGASNNLYSLHLRHSD
jgi:hypothetical protein